MGFDCSIYSIPSILYRRLSRPGYYTTAKHIHKRKRVKSYNGQPRRTAQLDVHRTTCDFRTTKLTTNKKLLGFHSPTSASTAANGTSPAHAFEFPSRKITRCTGFDQGNWKPTCHNGRELTQGPHVNGMEI